MGQLRDPFTTGAFDHTRGCFYICDLNLESNTTHMVVGIDERDLGSPPNPSQIHWLEPTEEDKQDGIPDTRYAFADLTSTTPIGNASAVKKFYTMGDTINCDHFPQFRSF